MEGTNNGALKRVAGRIGTGNRLDLDRRAVGGSGRQGDVKGLEVGVGGDGVLGQLHLLTVDQHLELGIVHVLGSLNAQRRIALVVQALKGRRRCVTTLGEVPNLGLAGLQGHGDLLALGDGPGCLGSALATLGVHVVAHD